MTLLAPVLDLLDSPAARRPYSEKVTQIDHALQCAALSTRDRADDALVAAALLHDIGHLLTPAHDDLDDHPDHDLRHEATGARFLRRFFTTAVTAPIALHVAAKRYLCAVDPAYAAGLSAASARSLGLQGGPMTPAESEAFLSRPGAERAVALRGWDDAAKVVGARPAPLATYVPVLERLARPS